MIQQLAQLGYLDVNHPASGSVLATLVPGAWRNFSRAPSRNPFYSTPAEFVSPAQEISIRNISDDVFTVVCCENLDSVLDELPAETALFYVHPGAVYVYRGMTYVVEHLDLSSRRATVVPRGVQYYTHTRDHTDVAITKTHCEEVTPQFSNPATSAHKCLGRVNVFTKVYGFYKHETKTGRVSDLIDMELPNWQTTNAATWVTVPDAVGADISVQGFDIKGIWYL
jgi:DEAD/DEAH box helicase domain-containing protein